jgi:hypothetical protein
LFSKLVDEPGFYLLFVYEKCVSSAVKARFVRARFIYSYHYTSGLAGQLKRIGVFYKIAGSALLLLLKVLFGG